MGNLFSSPSAKLDDGRIVVKWSNPIKKTKYDIEVWRNGKVVRTDTTQTNQYEFIEPKPESKYVFVIKQKNSDSKETTPVYTLGYNEKSARLVDGEIVVNWSDIQKDGGYSVKVLRNGALEHTETEATNSFHIVAKQSSIYKFVISRKNSAMEITTDPVHTPPSDIFGVITREYNGLRVKWRKLVEEGVLYHIEIFYDDEVKDRAVLPQPSYEMSYRDLIPSKEYEFRIWAENKILKKEGKKTVKNVFYSGVLEYQCHILIKDDEILVHLVVDTNDSSYNIRQWISRGYREATDAQTLFPMEQHMRYSANIDVKGGWNAITPMNQPFYLRHIQHKGFVELPFYLDKNDLPKTNKTPLLELHIKENEDIFVCTFRSGVGNIDIYQDLHGNLSAEPALHWENEQGSVAKKGYQILFHVGTFSNCLYFLQNSFSL